MTTLELTRGEDDGRFRRGLEEGKALLEVEVYVVGVVMVVAEGQVLADLEHEVAAPEAQDHRALHARGPHDLTAEDLADVVEDDQSAVLGGLHQAGVAVGPEGQPVGTADPDAEQGLDRLGHVAGVELDVLAEGDPGQAVTLGDADDAGGGPAVEDGHVLGLGDAAGRPVELGQIGIGGPAVDVAQLVPRHREVGPQLGQRQHPALVGPKPVARGGDRRHPAQVGGRMGPPVRPGEVHQPAGGQRRHHPLLDLVLELLPPVIGDRGVGAEQVVHWAAPFRLADTEGPAVVGRLSAGGRLLLEDRFRW